MFYQNNNDYMRDAFYYSQPQSNTYPYAGMNNYMNVNNTPYNYNMNNRYPVNPLENMYPQIYKIIDPVANRVISTNNYSYYTEDNIDNMVDTVYNIVEGDVSSLTSTTPQNMTSDDTVTQGPARGGAQNTNTRSNTTENVAPRTNTNESNCNKQLLKDLIKIIIIKELLSRPNNFNNPSYNFNNSNFNNSNCNMNNTNPQNFYDTRYMGMY